jgi:iron complex transport system permease protein
VTGGVTLPRRVGVLRVGGVSLRIDRRTVAVCALLLAAVLALGTVAITFGEFPISVAQILGSFTGAETSEAVRRIVLEWRMPRIVLAVVVGAALGLSGAVFQSLTRNPLGSPDIIGFTTGSYTGALITIIVLGAGYIGTAVGAVLGGLASAAIVYLLAWRRGVQGYRLIVVGIAVTAMLESLNAWLILRADLELAFAAASWSAGSFNEVRWGVVVPVAVALGLLLPALALVARPLKMLELGDDAARALGVRAEANRLALVVVAVLLVAIVTAAVGPVAFVALAAPQIGRWLSRAPGVVLLPAACTGALLVLAADVIAQRIIAPAQLPVGLVTLCLGGVYLLVLLTREARRRMT